MSIITYYKKHIFNLVDRLRNLDPSGKNYDILLEVQLYIIKRILHSEKKIVNLKKEKGALKKGLRTDRLSKKEAKTVKEKIDFINNRIDEYQWLLYIWRCFGDGIAFTYLDKWGLKSMIFESNSPDEKQQAGFLGGKEGIYKELALVLNAKQHGVPALLTDLTNTIRHGDICLLGASDPYVIEVKSSENKNNRVERQIENIQKIHNYLENDVAENIRGVPKMQRVVMQCDEIHYNKVVNETIENALEVGYCQANPEDGLYYFAYKTSYNVNYEEMFSGIKKPIVHLINQAKMEKTWGNYYPFTLSIKSAKSLYAFLKGDIYIIVVFDAAVMETLAQSEGFSFSVIMSGDAAYSLTKEVDGFEEPLTAIVSEHFAGRLAFEFLSLKWFMEIEKYNLEYMEKELHTQIKCPTNGSTGSLCAP